MAPVTLPESEHFTFHELADGVWAAIVKPTGLAASNSGIVDLGDRTLVFDTTLSPVSAADLRSAAENLTGRPVGCVLTSHSDRDHVFGNAAFSPQTEIYATARTRDVMLEQTPADILDFKKRWSEFRTQWAESAKTAKDEAERLDFEDGVRFAQRVVASFPQLELRLPDHTFTERLEFKGSKRAAEFVTLGGGHTDSDAFLFLPAERIIFTGDLLVVKNHPGLLNGHPHAWLGILAKIKSLDPVSLVPGHGEVGTQANVTLLERYLHETLRMAEQHWREGGTAESAAALQPPAFTEGWNNSDVFGANMKFLHAVVQQPL
jgi:glyoxylase-like metal-dependent hydrolase (beta-lactamase superfamily II)